MTKKLFCLLLISNFVLSACGEMLVGFNSPEEGFSIRLPKTPDTITPLIPEGPAEGFSGHIYNWKYNGVKFMVNAIVDPTMHEIKDLDEALKTSSGIEELEQNPNLTIESQRLADFNGLRGFEYSFTVRDAKLIGRAFIVGKKQRYLITATFEDSAQREFAVKKIDSFTAVALD